MNPSLTGKCWGWNLSLDTCTVLDAKEADCAGWLSF